MAQFTNVGEFQSRRGKGNKKTRLGPRITIRKEIRYEGQGGKKKEVLSPDDIALKKLSRLLGSIGKDKEIYVNLMKGADQLRFMSMPVLAQVFLLAYEQHRDFSGLVTGYDSILLGYINPLLPSRETGSGGTRGKEISEEELEIMRQRLAATFVRYARYITTVQERQRELQETQPLESVGIEFEQP